MLLFLFLFHLCVLDHVEESAVEDDLGLRVITVALHPKRLDLALILQAVEELLCEVVDIAENDTLIALAIRQGQLLQSDLILLRLSDGHKVARKILHAVNHRNVCLGHWLARGGLCGLAATRLTHGFEGNILDAHGHWDRIENFLERLGFEGLRRLSKSVLD